MVEGTGLENRRGFTPSLGSNPSPSSKRSIGVMGLLIPPGVYSSSTGSNPVYSAKKVFDKIKIFCYNRYVQMAVNNI